MNPKYRLKDGVYLVTGASRGAILDTHAGLVYSVNQQACLVCNYQLEDEPFWQTLASIGLAEQAEPACKQELPGVSEDGHLKFVWYEIVTNDCNQRCVHCYTNSMPKSHREDGMSQKLLPNNIHPKARMSYRDWLKAITEARDLGCISCQFIGGEPLLYKGENGETVFDLVKFAKDVGFSSIEIFTNATLLTRADIHRMKDLGVKVAVSLYSHDPVVHDRITRVPGSYIKTVKSLDLLTKHGIETRVETILMNENQDTIEATLAFKKQMGYNGRKPDLLRSSGRGESNLHQPDDGNLIKYGFRLRPDFKVSKEILAHYRSGHACLLGKIAITEFGDIFPCILAREHSLGNYLVQNSLNKIVNNLELQNIWHTTKDHVVVCKDCEYRYVCFDCRPLAEAAAAGRADFRTAPYPCCTYNPYSGEWGNGVWKVDENGSSFYDRSLAVEIRQVKESFEKWSHDRKEKCTYERQ